MKHENSVLNFTSELCVVPSDENTGSLSEFLDTCLEKADVSPKLANKMQIAADEVLANTRSYSGAAHIRILFALQDNTVIVTFSDDGSPYDPLTCKEPDTTAPAELRPIGGLGILLIKRMMDSVSYQHKDGLNILTLQLHISR